MTTTRTEDKKTPMTTPGTKDQKAPEHSPEELETAYQIHTLAQMLYGQITNTQPWMTPMPPVAAYETPDTWPPTPTATGAPVPWSSLPSWCW